MYPPPQKKINKTELPQKKIAHHPLKKLELPEKKKIPTPCEKFAITPKKISNSYPPTIIFNLPEKSQHPLKILQPN